MMHTHAQLAQSKLRNHLYYLTACEAALSVPIKLGLTVHIQTQVESTKHDFQYYNNITKGSYKTINIF